MDTSRFDRVGPAAGVTAVLLTVVSLALTGSDMPDFMDDPDKIVSYYADDPGKLMGGYVIDALGTILLIALVLVLGVFAVLKAGIARERPEPEEFKHRD